MARVVQQPNNTVVTGAGVIMDVIHNNHYKKY